MAIPQHTLLFIGGIALLATMGLFQRFADRWTKVLVEFSAPMLWGLFAISAMDVIVAGHVDPPVSEPVMPAVYLGVGMALVTFLFALYDLFEGVKQEASDVDVQGLGR